MKKITLTMHKGNITIEEENLKVIGYEGDIILLKNKHYSLKINKSMVGPLSNGGHQDKSFSFIRMAFIEDSEVENTIDKFIQLSYSHLQEEQRKIENCILKIASYEIKKDLN